MKGSKGRTALSYAAERGDDQKRGDVRFVVKLIRRGAAIDAKDNKGKTALLYAVESGNDKFVAKLIRHGATIDARNNKGRTALSQAAKRGRVNLIAKLVSNPAAVDAKDDKGRTALSLAAEHDQSKSITKLIELGADVDAKDNDGRTAVSYAAESGHEKVIATLGRLQADVNAKDNVEKTALSYAAEAGHGKVVAKLIRLHATVDAKDNDGRSALSYAAEQGHFEVVGILLQHGAAVDAPHSNGRTALSYAAEYGNADFVAKLIQHSAAVDAKDREGRSAVSHAVLKGKEVVVEQLFRSSVVGGGSNSVALFVAAAMGKLASLKELVAAGECVDCRTKDGRTPLFYAAEFGHADVIQHLIDNGASVAAKACVSNYSPRESETPLALAGRAGHMKVFQALVEAGAPVNVRRSDDGETPLISAARSDFFAGVQLLMSHGGCLHEDEVTEDEYPLIPGTLKTMRTLGGTTFEFEPMCSRVLIRLEEICLKLQESDAIRANEGTLVSFASILFRFCRLQIDIGKRESPLLRFIGSRAIANRIRDFHEELDHFVGMPALEQSENRWKEQWKDDQTKLLARLEEKLSTDEAFFYGLNSEVAKQETAVLLLYELKVCRREGQRPELQVSLERVVERFLQVCEMDTPVIPEWFVSRDDVEYHSWNLVRSEGEYYQKKIHFYEGKWRKTAVVIETSADASTFEQAAAQWYQLNHPNVVKLFGACHIGSPPFFIYELETQGVQLQEFLRKDANRPLVWKCMYEAALGLRYLHSRGVAHGHLQSKSFTVGSGIAKLNGTRQIGIQRRDGNPSTDLWLPPEGFYGSSGVSNEISFSRFEAYDIYAFGICVWEALTLKLPWINAEHLEMWYAKQAGRLPDRPASIGDEEWDLITKMCAAKPSERVRMNYVVNRLSKFVIARDQVSEAVRQAPRPSAETEDKTIEDHVFAELDGRTIPNALQYIGSGCEKLGGHNWMSDNVYPALKYIFALLREHHKTPMDTEVLRFCASLSRFQRYLRIAVSKKSVYGLARSRHVAEVHHVVYAELDRLLDAFDVLEADPIRVWRHVAGKLDESEHVGDDLKNAALKSHHHETPNANCSAVILKHFDTPSATHDLWTQAGLSISSATPGWYLSLRDLVFSESGEIGRGSFGAVYKGTWLNTLVVVKFMGYEEDFDTISTELLLHEVRVWYKLNHPHVLKMYGTCHVDKRYFVCEFASNGDLTDYLKKNKGNKHLMWQKLYEAALGLEYLHGQNISHNDLKCDNIMVGMDGKAKLIDFGLSCLLNVAEIQIEVKKMGAVNWRSPEYLAGGRPSFASDVYSFAMCIIEVISGEIPWERPMTPALIRFHLKKGNMPHIAVPISEKQRNLIQLVIKINPVERVRMSYVVDKLDEIAHDERANVRAP